MPPSFEALFTPGIERVEEVGPRLDVILKADGVGVKMSFEPDYVAPVWRLHAKAIEEGIVTEARLTDLRGRCQTLRPATVVMSVPNPVV